MIATPSVCRWRLVILGFLLVLGLCLVVHPSQACSRVFFTPTVTEPEFDTREIVVDATHGALTCHAGEKRARCKLELTYRIRNVSPRDLRFRAMIHGAHVIPEIAQSAAVDPSTATRLPVTREAVAPRTRSELDIEDALTVEDTSALTSTLAAGASGTLVVRADLDIGLFVELFGFGCSGAGILQRHPLAGSGQLRGTYLVNYLVRGSANATFDATLSHPSVWNGAIHVLPNAQSMTTRGGDATSTASVELRARRAVVSMEMEVPRSTFFNGGPFVGAGWSFAPDAGARMRLGYEIAAPLWLVHAVAIESELSRVLTIVPSTEAILNRDLIASAGVGVPMQLRTNAPARVGGRVQVGVGYGPLAVRGAVDLFTTHVEGSVFGQASF